MAFRAETLREIGGFDPTFRVAGDDVDVCWRLQEHGHTIGFAPSAMVWHHRRPSLRGFLRQQFQYGKAEALLERKWPERYNRRGHVTWAGRVYGNTLAVTLNRRRTRIQYGTWGEALFQSRQVAPPGFLSSLVRTPEWFLVLAGLAALGGLGVLWTPLFLFLGVLGAGAGVTAHEAWRAAKHARFTHQPRPRRLERRMRVITAWLHVAQPMARLGGRVRHGLAPWRHHGPRVLGTPRPRTHTLWSERWRSHSERLKDLEQALSDTRTRRGGEYERWDLEVRGGLLGAARIRTTLEEHGNGHQFARMRSWPLPSRAALGFVALMGTLAAFAFGDGALIAGCLMAATAACAAVCCVRDCSSAVGALRAGIRREAKRQAGDLPMEADTRVGGRMAYQLRGEAARQMALSAGPERTAR
jgi:hypothetical protein